MSDAVADRLVGSPRQLRLSWSDRLPQRARQLRSLARAAGSEPFEGTLYVFRAKRADRIKNLWWDASGVRLYAKRLEKAQFCWPRIAHSWVQLNNPHLLALVDGIDGGI
ncbi:IS66 family insertion sequence element accessory protein TnpB [Agrobacterium salinitolerans]|uniref:IS66 family insertion sequence element accessory protein TnpB n=1 Tax=Agrobacterium salinitolerans TaxID=1183413 RepID=UPI003FD0C18A